MDNLKSVGKPTSMRNLDGMRLLFEFNLLGVTVGSQEWAQEETQSGDNECGSETTHVIRNDKVGCARCDIRRARPIFARKAVNGCETRLNGAIIGPISRRAL